MEGCSESGIGEEGEGSYWRQGQREIGSEIGKVTGMAADVCTVDILGWGLAFGEVEVLLMIGGFGVTEVWKPSVSASRKVRGPMKAECNHDHESPTERYHQ